MKDVIFNSVIFEKLIVLNKHYAELKRELRKEIKTFSDLIKIVSKSGNNQELDTLNKVQTKLNKEFIEARASLSLINHLLDIYRIKNSIISRYHNKKIGRVETKVRSVDVDIKITYKKNNHFHKNQHFNTKLLLGKIADKLNQIKTTQELIIVGEKNIKDIDIWINDKGEAYIVYVGKIDDKKIRLKKRYSLFNKKVEFKFY
jgi:hypothetical protein